MEDDVDEVHCRNLKSGGKEEKEWKTKRKNGIKESTLTKAELMIMMWATG